MNRTEIATNWTLWQEYVDPSATMTREEFDAMPLAEKLQIQIDCFGPEEDSNKTYRIICDNGGGMILQLGGTWAHYYQSADQLIDNLADYLGGGDTSDWEGHEPEALECEPADDEIRNGGYRVFSDIADLDADSSWANERDIVKAIVTAKI